MDLHTHNSGADLYPYLILTAELTDKGLYQGRMMHMLRNEVRYTRVKGFDSRKPDAGDGRTGRKRCSAPASTSRTGSSPSRSIWAARLVHRMVDMMIDAMGQAAVESRFGKLPAGDAETEWRFPSGALPARQHDRRSAFLDWGRRIADAYIEEVLPGNHGLPSANGISPALRRRKLRLRDHGNETIVGLVLQYALEQRSESPRAESWRPSIRRMLDRVLQSANADGMLFNEVDAATLQAS